MKHYIILILLFVTGLSKAQNSLPLNKSESKGYLFESHFSYLFALGKVNIQGTNSPWVNTLYPNSPENQINEKDHDGNYLNLGMVVSKQLTPKLQLGVGLDLDFYFGIGDFTRYCLPLSLDLKYKIADRKNSFFLFAKPGFAPALGSDFYSGIKTIGGLGYSIQSAKTHHRYTLSIGYSFHQLKNLQQFVLTNDNEEGSASYLTSINRKNVIVHSLPISFGYTF